MKRIILLFSVVVALLVSGCSSVRNGIALGEQGNPTIVVSDLQASKADIRSVLMKVLREHDWNVLSDGNPIIAEKVEGAQHSKLQMQVQSGKVYIDSKGSTRLGKAFVPVAFMEDLRQSLVRDLRMGEFERYNKLPE